MFKALNPGTETLEANLLACLVAFYSSEKERFLIGIEMIKKDKIPPHAITKYFWLWDYNTSLATDYVTVCTSCDVQPRTVAGFRGTVRYASVNAHKNKVFFL